MSDHAQRIRQEFEMVAFRLRLDNITAEYRESLQALIEECRNRLGFQKPEEDEPTVH